MIPTSILAYYSFDPDYAAQRQRDCDIAVKYGLYEKIDLPNTRYRQSGLTDIPALAYNWFYNPVGKPPDLAYVISPDARVPNYSTVLSDALEIAMLRGITSVPVTASGSKGMQAMVDYILAA